MVLLLLIFFFERGIKPAWMSLNSDFPTYYVSAKMLLNGEDMAQLYNAEWFQDKLVDYGTDFKGRFSPFPPSNAFIMLPVAHWDSLTAKRIWIIISLCAFIWLVILLNRITNLSYLNSFLIILLTGAALANNFKYGKVYLIISALIVFAHLLQSRGKEILAGTILGICISLKYFPIVFVLSYLFLKKYKLVYAALTTLLVMLVIQIMTFGSDVFMDYINISLLPHLSGQIENVNPYAVAFQSWESLLRNIFVYHHEFNPNPLINWDFGKTICQFLLMLLFAVAVYWQSRRIFKYDRQNFQAIVIALPAFFCLTMLPAGATYHFLFLLFPLALYLSAFHNSLSRMQIYILIFLFTAIGFIPFGFVLSLGTSGFGILLSYPRLWLMSSFLICSIAFINTHLKKNFSKSNSLFLT